MAPTNGQPGVPGSGANRSAGREVSIWRRGMKFLGVGWARQRHLLLGIRFSILSVIPPPHRIVSHPSPEPCSCFPYPPLIRPDLRTVTPAKTVWGQPNRHHYARQNFNNGQWAGNPSAPPVWDIWPHLRSSRDFSPLNQSVLELGRITDGGCVAKGCAITTPVYHIVRPQMENLSQFLDHCCVNKYANRDISETFRPQPIQFYTWVSAVEFSMVASP